MKRKFLFCVICTTFVLFSPCTGIFLYKSFSNDDELFLLQISQNVDNVEIKMIGIVKAEIQMEEFRIFREDQVEIINNTNNLKDRYQIFLDTRPEYEWRVS